MLHKNTNESTGGISELEYIQIVEQFRLERAENAPRGWLDMLKKKSYRKRLLLGFAVQFIAQSTGVLVVNNYQVLLYGNLGLTGSLPLALNGVYNALAAFMNWINSLILDRFGRIRIMIIGLVGRPKWLIMRYLKA